MNDFLSQEEIDALLNGQLSDNQDQNDHQDNILNELERDALGEIGNISMGSAATALSQLLNQRVNITTPQVQIISPRELLDSFQVPFMIIEVGFTKGLEGSNLLVLKVTDAMVIADLMLGGDGTNLQTEISELHSSAVAEAMNQMMGSAATSMSSLFSKAVVISTPKVQAVSPESDIDFPWNMDERVVIVSFKMEVGNLINSSIMQILPAEVAKSETSLLLGMSTGAAASKQEDLTMDKPDTSQPEIPAGSFPEAVPAFQVSEAAQNSRNLDLILDVPLKVSVVLGRTKRPIKEVLNLLPGSIVELEKLAEEPVDILINGTPIARGEVVVINENFGVKITSIESPAERIGNLKK